jgi:hypothetical protein
MPFFRPFVNSLTDRKETTCLVSRISTLSCAHITLSTVKLSLSLCFRAYGLGLSSSHLYYVSKQCLYIIKTKHPSRLERVEQFKHLGTPLTNKNYIQEEIKSRLKLGNACYYSVQNILSSSVLSKKLKINIYRTIILPLFCTGVKLGR